METGEDAPELTPVNGLVIAVVCLGGGAATVLGLGTFATAIVTLHRPYSIELLLLSFGTIVTGVAALTVYFLAGGADGAVRGHQPFESILFWVSAASIAGMALALIGVAVRSFDW